ncbi:MAG TPA: glycosyltransferase family 2 protein [Terracidiphilus sp.]|nr:glycosyltransferase family 2 protein [Terracidiphilus sp.]
MGDTTQSWSIIIFCYNEEGTLRSVIEEVQSFFAIIHCVENEIVIVDDGSTDNCREIVRQAAETFPNIRPVYHPRNMGIGAALRSGYAAVRYDNVSAVPADAQFNVAELIPYAILANKTFVSFFRKENTIYSFSRNVLSYVNRRLNAAFLGLRQRDVNWVKVYKRAALQKLNLKMKSSLVESEICAKLVLQKNQMIEMQSVYLPRKAGQSRGASLPIVLRAALETLKLICVVSLYRITRSRK